MSGLLQDRMARVGAWTNSMRKTRKLNGGLTAPANESELHQNNGFPVDAAPAALTRTVEREVIPRMVLAHQPAREESHLPTWDEVVEFTRLVVAKEVPEAMARIAANRAQGTSLETLYMHLLIPAARRLSDLWEADLCHYEEIAVGMLHLRQVLQELSACFALECEYRSNGPKVLLVSAPGERNMLGVFMATEFYRCVTSEFFYRAGWQVWRAPPASRAQLLELARAEWFDVIDISVGCEARLPMLRADLNELRRASHNEHVGLTVGGPVFTDHAEFVRHIGADASAANPRDTLAQAELLVALHERYAAAPFC